MILGINVPTAQRAGAELLRASGSLLVRQVATGGAYLSVALSHYRAAEQKILLVLANESKESCPSPSNWIEWYADKYAHLIDYVQCWNEPDGPHGGSSAPISPALLNSYIRRARAAFPSIPLVGPGLITGQPQYVTNIETQYLDYLAVHAYWKAPQDLKPFLDNYRVYAPQLPIMLTEFDLRLDFVQAATRIPYVTAAIPYCWQRWSGWPHALVDEAENRLPLYTVFQESARFVQTSNDLKKYLLMQASKRR